MTSYILGDSGDGASLNKAEATNTEKQIVDKPTEGGFIVEKIKYLEYAAWTYLGLSVLGGFFLMDEIGFAIGFAVILQSVVVSGFLLVFCDLASTISTIDNRVKKLDKSLQEIVKKDDRPAQSASKAKPVVNKRPDDKITEKVDFTTFIKNKEHIDNEMLASNIALVSLRSGPGDNYAVVGKVEKGMELVVLQSQNEWLKVQTKEGLEGWLKDLYVYKF